MTKEAGVWTPWAEVLCAPCHNRDHKLQIEVLRAVEESAEQGWCMDCGKPVWLDSDVARLSRLHKLIGSKAQMEQTGGMCCALSIRRDDGGTVVVSVDDAIFIGLYSTKEWGCDEPAALAEVPGTADDKKALAAIRKMLRTPMPTTK